MIMIIYIFWSFVYINIYAIDSYMGICTLHVFL